MAMRCVGWLTVLLAMTMVMPGCGGCSQSATPEELAEEEQRKKEEEGKKQKEKSKPDFERVKLYVQPDIPSESKSQVTTRGVKPGHWSVATEEMKANNFEFVGELETTLRESRGLAPIDLENTPFRLSVVRPAPLPKRTQKFFDVGFFVPRGTPRPLIQSDLRGMGGGSIAHTTQELLTTMPPQQYYLVVIAKEPERYKTLGKLASIRAPGPYDPGSGVETTHYRVAAPVIGKRIPLPAHSLAWTQIAYVLWDDIDPSLLDPNQQQAMLDWLHWGGQLIVSGPGTLDKLKQSFLDASPERSVLPALPGGAKELSPAKLAEMGAGWTTPKRSTAVSARLLPPRPWSTVALIKQPGAEYVPETAEQVVERSVGRGRVAVTSFRIGQPTLLNWVGFDGFFNAVLLRRPPREFYAAPTLSGAAVRWSEWTGTADRTLDPMLTTSLRYLSRDLDDEGAFLAEGLKGLPGSNGEEFAATTELSDTNGQLDDADPIGKATLSGIGGWNDTKGMASAARASLREAAGIKIPTGTFVVFVLAVYLAVLAPLNWLVFRALGRLEWAWVAAPAIAVACAMAVIRLAQLDIGFARSQTEVALIEAHGDYPRALVTRYTALYSSLTTTYDITFEDKDALALPFGDPEFRRAYGQTVDTVTSRRDESQATLSGFVVNSNSTSMLHSEQMFDLGGAISYVEKEGRRDVFNRTKFRLKNAGLIRLGRNGAVETAWIGELAAGGGAAVNFVIAPNPKQSLLKPWDDLTANSAAKPEAVKTDVGSGKVHLNHLLSLAQKTASMGPGEIRLIATIDEALPGVTVTPEAAQNDRSAGLLVAHLRAGTRRPPKADVNCLLDFKEEPAEPEDE